MYIVPLLSQKNRKYIVPLVINVHGQIHLFWLIYNFTSVRPIVSYMCSLIHLNLFPLRKLYAESLARFQAGSPYIYPMYGLGELPQVSP